MRRLNYESMIAPGVTFGHLTVLDAVTPLSIYSVVRCECKCGSVDEYITRGLLRGQSFRCRTCAKAAISSTRISKRTKQPDKENPAYSCWKAMRDRCYMRSHVAYPRYGGRGIDVCDKWRRSFHSFLNDVGERPSMLYTLERIDNDGNYEPGNVRWATKLEQGSNKRNNRLLSVNGRTMALSEWSRATGLHSATIAARIHSGWSVQRAIETPAKIVRWKSRRTRAARN
jgi:hypothetical protein